jgi:hypothetical protein
MVIAVLAAVIAVAAGFCVFDDHAGAAHDHGISIDLCLGMLGVLSAVPPLMALSAVGWAIPALAAAMVPATLHVLDPPPRSRPVR